MEQLEHDGTQWHRTDTGDIYRAVNGKWEAWHPGHPGTPPPQWLGTQKGSLKSSEIAALIAIAFGGLVVWFTDAKMDLDEIFGSWVPWAAGLFGTGTLYASLVQTKAHENLSDHR